MKFKVGDIICSRSKPKSRYLQITEVTETDYGLSIVKHDRPEKYPIGSILFRPKEEVEQHTRLVTKLDKALK